VVSGDNFSISHGFRHITIFRPTVYVIACDIEQSFKNSTGTVEITSHVGAPPRALIQTYLTHATFSEVLELERLQAVKNNVRDLSSSSLALVPFDRPHTISN